MEIIEHPGLNKERSAVFVGDGVSGWLFLFPVLLKWVYVLPLVVCFLAPLKNLEQLNFMGFSIYFSA